MDDQRFDNLSRSFATGTTRRHALRLLAGVGASALALAGRREASAYDDTCRSFILSGGPNPEMDLCVDDALTVRVNGVVIYKDPDRFASCIEPIAFNSRVGRRLQIIARDFFAPCRSLSQVWLHCADGGTPRRLTNGVYNTCYPEGQWEQAKFFDRTYTI